MSHAPDDDTPRDATIRRVMRNLARRAINLGPLPVQTDDGEYPVIVMLPDDSVGDMEQRRNRVSRDANIVVAYPERMVLIAMRDAVREDPAEVHPDSTMDMLVEYLRTHPDAAPAIRVGTLSAPLVEDLEYAF